MPSPYVVDPLACHNAMNVTVKLNAHLLAINGLAAILGRVRDVCAFPCVIMA